MLFNAPGDKTGTQQHSVFKYKWSIWYQTQTNPEYTGKLHVEVALSGPYSWYIAFSLTQSTPMTLWEVPYDWYTKVIKIQVCLADGSDTTGEAIIAILPSHAETTLKNSGRGKSSKWAEVQTAH